MPLLLLFCLVLHRFPSRRRKIKTLCLQFEVFEVSKAGGLKRTSVTLADVLRDFGVHARDVLSLGLQVRRREEQKQPGGGRGGGGERGGGGGGEYLESWRGVTRSNDCCTARARVFCDLRYSVYPCAGTGEHLSP